jgi:hypothetical protein
VNQRKGIKMKPTRKFTEEQLQLSWCRLKQGSSAETVSGKEIVIYSPGTWNLEAGPDFGNAKIAIDGRELTGNVEIHKKASDWINHGHSSDPRYSDIILHVVAEDDASPDMRRLLPDAPVLILNPRFSGRRISPADKFPAGKCRNFFASLDDMVLYKFFRKAGLKRFNGKVFFMLDNMYEKGSDKEFTEQLFDACGYKQNRNNFRELFARVSRYDDLNDQETEAVIWGESGLLPDPATVKLDRKMSGFVKSLWNIWWRIRQEPLPDIKWNRSGLRPMNFPERRIAAITMLMAKMEKFPLMYFANFAKNPSDSPTFAKKIIKSLKCSHPVWDGYINFTSRCAVFASVLGEARAADICANVVLPALKAQRLLTEKQARETGNASAPSIAEEAFKAMHPIQSNRLIENAAFRWFSPPSRKRDIIKDAVSQQGIIHIYRNFCEGSCVECEFCPLAHLMNK